jgi:hypothetical protein
MEEVSKKSSEILINPENILNAGSSIKKSVTFTVLSAICGFICIILIFVNASLIINSLMNGRLPDSGGMIALFIFAVLDLVFWIASLASLFSAGCRIKESVNLVLTEKLIKSINKPFSPSDDTNYKKADYNVKEIKKIKSFMDGDEDEYIIEFSNGKNGEIYYSETGLRFYFKVPNLNKKIFYKSKESAISGLDYWLQTSKIAEENI